MGVFAAPIRAWPPFDSVLQFVTDEVSSNFGLARVKRHVTSKRRIVSICIPRFRWMNSIVDNCEARTVGK